MDTKLLINILLGINVINTIILCAVFPWFGFFVVGICYLIVATILFIKVVALLLSFILSFIYGTQFFLQKGLLWIFSFIFRIFGFGGSGATTETNGSQNTPRRRVEGKRVRWGVRSIGREVWNGQWRWLGGWRGRRGRRGCLNFISWIYWWSFIIVFEDEFVEFRWKELPFGLWKRDYTLPEDSEGDHLSSYHKLKST